MERYPARLRDRGIGGRADVFVLIDPDGDVAGTRARRAEGHPDFGTAGEQVLALAAFTPTVHGGCRAWALVELEATFEVSR